MKHQSLFYVFLVSLIALLASCNDTLPEMGYSIQPGGDSISVSTGTLALEARTVNVDSIYIKTKYPVLGEYSDPVYGTIKSDYIGEFYHSEISEFHNNAVIDSVRLAISYSSFIGDSLTPMQVSAYRVINALPKQFGYTNIDPLAYCDMSAALGAQSFTGKNSTYRREAYYPTGSSSYVDTLTVYDIYVDLPKSIGEQFLEEFQKPKPNAFDNADTFREYFKGMYVTTTFGSGTVLNVNLTTLSVHYHYLDPGGSVAGLDTIRTSTFDLNITPEVVQINHIDNRNEVLLQQNNDFAFVSSPANVNTEIVFPFSEISDKLNANSLNQAKLVVYASPEESQNSLVKLGPPSDLLLIHQDSIKSFFEKRKLPDNRTSFLASFARSTFSYDFKNVSSMVNYYKELDQYKNGQEEFKLTFVLIPVDVTYQTQTDIYGNTSTTSTPLSIYHQMMPTATSIYKSPDKLKMDLIYSSFY